MERLNELIKLLIKKEYVTEKEILKIDDEIAKKDFEGDLLASAGEALG